MAIRESDHHPVTKFLHSPLALNTIVQITEGQGKLYLNQEHIHLCPIFIAEGIGVTPILSMTRVMSLINADFKLFHSNSFAKDFVLKNELRNNSIFITTKENSQNKN